MTPLQLEFLLHYFYSPEPPTGDSYMSAAGQEGLRSLLKENLLSQDREDPTKYHITERGEVYVKHLLEVPLPVQQWAIPKK
mgnify:CR=1 FL=1